MAALVKICPTRVILRREPHPSLLCAKYKQDFLPYISNLVTGPYTLNNFHLKQTEDVSNPTNADESSSSYEAFKCSQKVDSAWLGLSSQCKL